MALSVAAAATGFIDSIILLHSLEPVYVCSIVKEPAGLKPLPLSNLEQMNSSLPRKVELVEALIFPSSGLAPVMKNQALSTVEVRAVLTGLPVPLSVVFASIGLVWSTPV